MYSTGEGVVGVEDINLLAAVSVDVARRHPDGVALAVPQRVEGRAAVVDGDVDEPFPLLVVLEHKVRAVVAVNTVVERCYVSRCHFETRPLKKNLFCFVWQLCQGPSIIM